MMIRSCFTWTLCLGLVACSSDEEPSATPNEGGVPDAHVSHDAAKDVAKEASKPPPKDAGHEGAIHPDASDGGEAGAAPYPPLLSETGLYADIKKGTLGNGVRPYEVKYPLWSDGAEKKRWVLIPSGKKIDTSDMNFWSYPVGTKAWKEFSIANKRVETRLQYKSGPNPEDWVMIAYQWKSDGSDAVAVPDGVPNASGTTHDIPPTDDCRFCHENMLDRLLGFNAIQLSHNLPGLTITDLISENLLTDPPAGPFTLPGDTTTSNAIGYLHGNCGDCHNPHSSLFITVDMQLWEDTSTLDTVEHTTVYRKAVNQPN